MTSLTAASGEQIASWDEEAKHGLFTHHLLDALYGKGDEDKDGKVTAQETKRYLDRRMTRAARRVHRRVQKASLMGSGEVVLASAAKELGFPARPGLGGGAAAVAAPKAAGEAVRAPAPKAPDHAAAEAALGLAREARVLVQRGLTELKLKVGYADGLFGNRTRGAIREWQEGKGMEATGYLTEAQAAALVAVGEGGGGRGEGAGAFSAGGSGA